MRSTANHNNANGMTHAQWCNYKCYNKVLPSRCLSQGYKSRYLCEYTITCILRFALPATLKDSYGRYSVTKFTHCEDMMRNVLGSLEEGQEIYTVNNEGYVFWPVILAAAITFNQSKIIKQLYYLQQKYIDKGWGFVFVFAFHSTLNPTFEIPCFLFRDH